MGSRVLGCRVQGLGLRVFMSMCACQRVGMTCEHVDGFQGLRTQGIVHARQRAYDVLGLGFRV